MIRKLSVLVFAVLLTTGMISDALASNGTQIGTVGARSTAMGSCFRGLADDWSAFFFNPAGLTLFSSKWTIGGSVGLIMARGDHTPYNYPTVPFSGIHTNPCELTPKNYYIPSIGISYRLTESIVVGLSVYVPFGLGTEWDLLTLPSTYGYAEGISKEKEHYSDHQVINIQPTVAIQLTDRLSVGLGVSYITGDMTIDNVALPLNPAAARWSELQMLAAFLGLTLTDLTADQYRFAVENNLDGSGSAYGLNVGLHFKVTEKLHLGLSGRYSTDLKLKGTLKQTYIMHGDPAKAGAIMGIPAIYLADENDPTGTQNQQQLVALFSGQNIVMIDEKEAKADLPLPMTIGGGIAFKPSHRLTLTADVSWTNWAKWDVIPIEGEDGELASFRQDWKNTIEMGAGLEWMVKQKETSQFFLRGGFYTVDTPAPDETISPTILDPIRRTVITGGFGLNLGKVSFNLAYEHVLFGEKDLEQYVFDSETGVSENYAGKYDFIAHVITFGTSINLGQGE